MLDPDRADQLQQQTCATTYGVTPLRRQTSAISYPCKTAAACPSPDQVALQPRRFKDSEKTRAADQAELDAAAAEIAEFERRDVKFKEDRRHCKAKLKKAEEKLAKDATRLQACSCSMIL